MDAPFFFLMNAAYPFIRFFQHFFRYDKENTHQKDEDCPHHRTDTNTCNCTVIAYKKPVQENGDSDGKYCETDNFNSVQHF